LCARRSAAEHQALGWHNATFALADKLHQPVADPAQAPDLSLDLLYLLLRPVADSLRDVRAVFGQCQQFSNLSERIPVRLHLLDELHQRDDVRPVDPITSGRARRRGEQSSSLVEADGLHVHSGSFGEFTDSHHSLMRAVLIMRPVLRYQVKRPRSAPPGAVGDVIRQHRTSAQLLRNLVEHRIDSAERPVIVGNLRVSSVTRFDAARLSRHHPCSASRSAQ
jgi:hypothetical protein